MCEARRQRNYQSAWIALANYVNVHIVLLKTSSFSVVMMSLRDTFNTLRLCSPSQFLFPPILGLLSALQEGEILKQEMIRTPSSMLAHKLALCFLMPCPSGSCRPWGPWSRILFLWTILLGLGCQACSDPWLVLTPLGLQSVGRSSPHCWPQGSSWTCSASWPHPLAASCLVLTGVSDGHLLSYRMWDQTRNCLK